MQSRFAKTFAAAALAIVGLAYEPPPRVLPSGEDASRPSSERDTTYGRIDGDLSVVAGVGVAVGPRSPRAAADLRFRYIETAGIFATYEDGKAFGDSADPVRVLAGGIE